MEAYDETMERSMRLLFESLSEKDRRRYAAVEAIKLGHGGIEYIAGVMQCDPKTIRQGQAELEQLPTDPVGDRVRKKGVAAGRTSGSSIEPQSPSLLSRSLLSMAAGAGVASIHSMPRS
jgi:hypothetical protein